MIEFNLHNFKKPCINFGVGLFIFFAAVNFCSTGFSQEIEEQGEDEQTHENVVSKINGVVLKIYDEAMAAKGKVKELANFDETCLIKNKDGFLTIAYEIQLPAAGGKTTLYAIKLDIEPITAKTYVTQVGYFNYTMPLLNLQFSGYVIKHPLRRQFDLAAVLNKYAQELADYQQQFMPLRFLIIPLQDSFRVGEPIRFKVVLANSSKENILVKGLGQDSLFFTLNGAFWGTKQGEAQTLSAKDIMRQERQKAREARAAAREQRRKEKSGVGTTIIQGKRTQVGDKLILREDEALTIEFVGEGYKRPQEIEIRGVYHLSVKGLKPTAKALIQINP